MDIYQLIVAGHVIATILGVGGATIAEFQITHALEDSKVSRDERALMHVNYSMIRVGMFLMFVSVVAMFWYHLSQGNEFILTSEKLWIKELMFVAIIINAVVLTKRWIPLWLGASISFTSWWGATLLGISHGLSYSFETYLISYIVAIFAVAYLLHLMRKLRSPQLVK